MFQQRAPILPQRHTLVQQTLHNITTERALTLQQCILTLEQTPPFTTAQRPYIKT